MRLIKKKRLLILFKHSMSVNLSFYYKNEFVFTITSFLIQIKLKDKFIIFKLYIHVSLWSIFLLLEDMEPLDLGLQPNYNQTPKVH